MENALAAVAVERFDDHLAALLLHKLFQSRNFVGNKRRRNRAGKIQRIEFFVSFAETRWTVQHKGAMRVGEAEQHRGIEIVGVGGRILAHEDRVEVLERILRAIIEVAEMRYRAHHFAAPRPCQALMAAAVKILEAEKKYLMAASDCFEHKDESGVLVGQHAFERIHHEGKLVRHFNFSRKARGLRRSRCSGPPAPPFRSASDSDRARLPGIPRGASAPSRPRRSRPPRHTRAESGAGAYRG